VTTPNRLAIVDPNGMTVKDIPIDHLYKFDSTPFSTGMDSQVWQLRTYNDGQTDKSRDVVLAALAGELAELRLRLVERLREHSVLRSLVRRLEERIEAMERVVHTPAPPDLRISGLSAGMTAAFADHVEKHHGPVAYRGGKLDLITGEHSSEQDAVSAYPTNLVANASCSCLACRVRRGIIPWKTKPDDS